ncbi:MAG: High-affinity zinc uptake system binding-protein ZnuA precursor [Deltaproteobacteria bacterium ADurb.Bin510]|nr:MAG: High-affinity zinc uptake system binding-protein ZnuA precursor [Deltaproteobacteria bacterium ADurb.Bin510]
MKRLISLCALVLLCPALLAAAPLRVYVTILPQQYFVRQIAGDLASVGVLVPPGAEPHSFEPRPRQMAELAKARLYFTIGVGSEQVWLRRIRETNPGLRTVATDAGIRKIAMVAGHENGLDPHIWLSPRLVRLQAANIAAGLIAADPTHAAVYRANLKRFTAKLDGLDRQLGQILKDRPSFMTFHPAWGYFARDYGLRQLVVEVEGKEPKPAQLQQLIMQARRAQIGVVLVEPQFSDRAARIIASEVGAQVRPADDLSADWAANLVRVAQVIANGARP